MDQAQSSTDKLFTTLKGAAGALGIAFSAQAVVGFVGKVFDAAEAVQDLSDSLGVSTDAVQKFKYAAEQGGGTIDDVGRALQKMNQNLAEGLKSTYDALKTLGLGFEEIRQQNPEDAFLAITDALKDIEDPMLRTKLQMELFGKAAAGLSASIATGFRESADAAFDHVRSRRLRISPTRSRRGKTSATKSSLSAATSLPARFARSDQVTKTWKNFLIFAANASTMGVGVAALLANATAEAEKTAQALEQAAAQQGGLNKEMGQTKVEAAAAAEAARKMAEALNKASAAGVKAFKDYHEGLKNVDETMDKFVSQTLKDLHDRGRKILQLTTDDAVKLGLALTQGMAAGQKTVEGLGNEFAQLGQKIKPIPPEVKKIKLELDALAQSLTQLATIAGGSFGALAKELATMVAAMATMEKATKGLKTGFQDLKASEDSEATVAAFTNIAASAISMASAFLQATETGTKLQKTLKGATLGAQIGAQFGAIGAAIGAGIGGLAGLLRGVFGKNEGRKMVDEFAKGLGGFKAIEDQLRALGEEGQRLWKQLTQGARNPAQAQAAIDAVNKALADMPKHLNNVVAAAAKAGSGLDAAMLPYIEDLIRAGQLTEENANLLLGLPAAGVPSFNEVSAAAEALGLNIDTIGESIKQLGFTEAAENVAKNLDILQRAGADMDAVLTGARDQIQKLVDDAQRFGRSLPESIKPFLQEMVNSGKLTDIFGEKLSDLEDLHFTKPLEKSVEDLIVALHELVDTIKQDVGGALDDIGRKVVRPKIAPEYLPATGGPAALPPDLSAGEAAIRERGTEAPPAQQTIIVEFDGRQVAASTVPYLPGEIQRFVAT